jgi:hypothetical protein
LRGRDAVALDEHPAQAAPKGAPVAAWVVGGAGLLAVGSFAYFGLSGSNEASNLRQTCAPRCADASVADVKSKLLVADVSLGAGVVSLAVAGYLLFLAPRGDGPEQSTQAARVSFDVVPAARGQMAVLSGAF